MIVASVEWKGLGRIDGGRVFDGGSLNLDGPRVDVDRSVASSDSESAINGVRDGRMQDDAVDGIGLETGFGDGDRVRAYSKARDDKGAVAIRLADGGGVRGLVSDGDSGVGDKGTA